MLKPLGTVAAGEWLQVEGGGFARVCCVVLSPITSDSSELFTVGPIAGITAWHPVRLRGAWHFPSICGQLCECSASHMVNIVLAPKSGAYEPLLVDGIPCVTLGHGLTEHGAAHGFWGTRRVLDALSAHEGWRSGRIVLAAPLRDPHATMQWNARTFNAA